MRVASPSSQATTALKDITAAANHNPAKPIKLSQEVFNALSAKLVKLAKTDAPKASGLVDLMEELHKNGKLEVGGGKTPPGMGFLAGNAFNNGLNPVKEVLNNNASAVDDKQVGPLMR